MQQVIGNETEIDTNAVENPLEPEEPKDPKKSISKDSSSGQDKAAVAAGDTIAYQIEYYNHNRQRTDVTIVDRLDQGVKFKSASNDGVYDEARHEVVWKIEKAEALTWGKVILEVSVAETEEDVIKNNAAVQIGNDTEVKTNTVENPFNPEKPLDPADPAKPGQKKSSGSFKSVTAAAPKTGDQNGAKIIVLSAIAALSLLALIVLCFRRRHRSNGR